MNPDTKKKLIWVAAIVAIILIGSCVYKKYMKEETYAMAYPFSPTDPKQVVPWDTQSVYGLPPNLFDLNQCNYSGNQKPCAWKSLGIVEAQQNFADNINVQFEANDTGRRGDVGAAYLMSIADVEPRFWSWL
jgi:hypothetical protein